VENITKNADIQTRVENKSIFINENFENAQLFDITGRKIADIDNNLRSVTVSTSGIYILKVTRGNEVYTAKVAVK
ncbi:MAG: T9SS type A sorting domain-containing protein, partial [Paludibacter sp.]|nr:T9SS type A sorting domain-containing protein [Paludibacter sp.]